MPSNIDVRAPRYLDRLRRTLIEAIEEIRPTCNAKRDIYTNGPRSEVRPNSPTGYYLAYRQYLDDLDDPETKRLLFDARQAQQFDAILDVTGPDRELREAVHPPFNKIYVELSEPIYVGDTEPGHDDILHAFTYEANIGDVIVPTPRQRDDDSPYDPAADAVDMPVAEVNMFLTEPGRDGRPAHVDRSFKMNLTTGLGFVPVGTACQDLAHYVPGLEEQAISQERIEFLDLSERPWVREPKDGSLRPMKDWEIMVAGMKVGAKDNDHPRRIGWYERAVQRYADFITYIFAYTSAKSVRVIEAPLTRQERRWHHRKKTMPRPWHIIDVDPKFYRPGETDEESERHVSYRFDVIGHFRSRMYKTKAGPVHHISWVPPHQRGLANSLYIPATHRVKGGKEISPVMSQVYGGKGTEQLEGERDTEAHDAPDE